LTASKLVELAIIPVIFVVQTFVSLGCAFVVSRLFGFKKRPRNFVTAMAVFGNSNSLPISLVISLSKTLKGLHWDRIPGDNDGEVAARGILYLLIFQQLGQLVRWSWGYHVLLAGPEKYTEEEGGTKRTHQLEAGTEDDSIDDPAIEERQPLLAGSGEEEGFDSEAPTRVQSRNYLQAPSGSISGPSSHSGTPRASSSATLASLNSEIERDEPVSISAKQKNLSINGLSKAHQRLGHSRGDSDLITQFPDPSPTSSSAPESPGGIKSAWMKTRDAVRNFGSNCRSTISTAASSTFKALPQPLQTLLSKIYYWTSRFLSGLWEFMNPPLWAMLAAIIVASIPKLQHLFFDPGTFVENSVTRAVGQSGGVAVPLILVVLGANLARNTLPREERQSTEDPKLERNILIASLLCRMLLPTICMAPLLALTAKYVPISILADPIFVIVCFLLTGAPSALQLAQICQLNNVYMGAMSKLLFQSYVIWILPSTLMLVMLALETVEWAKAL
jgi:predicted permease